MNTIKGNFTEQKLEEFLNKKGFEVFTLERLMNYSETKLYRVNTETKSYTVGLTKVSEWTVEISEND